MNKKAVKPQQKKNRVKKQKIQSDKQQTQTQKQVVNIHIGDKANKVKRRRKTTGKPTKKTVISSPTIIMNPHTPNAPLTTQQPMERQPIKNSILPTRPLYPPTHIPVAVPEYSSVDYLDDGLDRGVVFSDDNLRAERLRRFSNEPFSRVNQFDDISDLTSEEYYPPPAPPNSVGSDFYLPAPQTPIASVARSSKKSENYPEFAELYPDREGTAGSVFYNTQRSGAVLNPQEQDVIQSSEMDLINQSDSGAIGGRGLTRVAQARLIRGEQARHARQAIQLSEGVGADVPDALLLQGQYYLAGQNRRKVPTMNQRYRLFALGKPYKGDENGVVTGRRKKKN
jgi:hypothetical protein